MEDKKQEKVDKEAAGNTVCPICKIGQKTPYSSRETLLIHMESRHMDREAEWVGEFPERDKKHICDLCNKSYISYDGLQTHKKYIHSLSRQGRTGPRISKKAGNTSAAQDGKERPAVMPEDKKSIRYYTCKFCNRSFNNQSALSKHKRDRHSKFTCKICNVSYLCQSSFKRHKLKCYKKKCNKCIKCDKKFESKSSLDGHIKSCPGTHKCLKCGKQFANISNVNRHDKICQATESHDCFKCERVLKSKELLELHIKNCHENASENDFMVPYICGKCEASYANESSLQKHKKQCGSVKKPEATSLERKNGEDIDEHKTNCDKCQRRFQNILDFKDHKKSCRHECDQCEETFDYQWQYDQHLNIKHSPTMKTCKKCDFIGGLQATMDKHYKDEHSQEDRQ